MSKQEVKWFEVALDSKNSYYEAMYVVSGKTLHLAVSKTAPARWTWVIHNEEAAGKDGSPFASHGSCLRLKEAKAKAVFWANKIFS